MLFYDNTELALNFLCIICKIMMLACPRLSLTNVWEMNSLTMSNTLFNVQLSACPPGSDYLRGKKYNVVGP